MLTWTIEKLNLQLKYTWKIARNATNTKTNFYVKVQAKEKTGIGEVAPNIRFHETPEKVLSEFGIILNNELPIVKDLPALQKLLDQFKVGNSLRCGIENAYIDWYCKKEKISPFSYLNLPKHTGTPTAFTVPIMDTERLQDFFLKNDLHRFKYIKVKVDAETGLETIREMDNITEQPLMVDANEAWKDVNELLYFLEEIKDFNIHFVEQPLPAYMDEEYYELKEKTPLPLFADESITNKPDFVKLKRQFHGVNMKIMKAGGVENGAKILKEAKAYEMQTMVGCMVETTVGISNGYYLAGLADYIDLDSFMYLESDPAKIIKETEGNLTLVNSK